MMDTKLRSTALHNAVGTNYGARQIEKTSCDFHQEFKMVAVRMATEGGKPVAKVARELGISRKQLDR